MAKRKTTSRVTVRKHVHVSTAHYPALAVQPYAAARVVPYIRLRGHWLANAGFSPSDRLVAPVEPGRIILTRG